jgi:CheY-like chemotaxis protein
VKKHVKADILIVDDDEGIRDILRILFVKQGFTIRVAGNGRDALVEIEKKEPDLIISDIQMPFMDGFELFGVIKLKYPRIKHILMTSYDVDQYISVVRKYNIGNVIIKGNGFSLDDISTYVRSILSGDVFGLQRLFPGTVVHTESVASYAQAKRVCASIVEHHENDRAIYLEVAIDELISNAFFHGVLQMSEVPREFWSEDFVVLPEKAIKVAWANDNEKIGVAIEDPQGNLKKIDALKWLDTCRDEKLGEEHGRGLLLVRRLIDRLIINIDPGKRTECIIVQYFNKENSGSTKPLLIHEL